MTDTTSASQQTQAPQQTQPWVRIEGQDHDAAIDGYELFSARRALALLKHRLGREALLELLAEDIATGNDFLREQVRLSAGEELTGTVALRAGGIDAVSFGGWLARAFGREDVLLAAHPEHYSIHHAPGRDVNIVETLGPYVCSFFMRPWNADTAGGNGPAAGGGARRSHIVLEDGSVVGSISTAFQDADGGLVGQLSVTLPATCAALVEQHLEHFAVEFRTWILQAARKQNTPATPA